MQNISIVNFNNIAIYRHGQYTVHIVAHIAYIVALWYTWNIKVTSVGTQ